MQGQIQVKIRIDRLVVSEFVGGGRLGRANFGLLLACRRTAGSGLGGTGAKGSESVDSSPIWADLLKVDKVAEKGKARRSRRTANNL